MILSIADHTDRLRSICKQWMCALLSQVVHVLLGNGIRFFITATKNIAAGTEISVPFNFDYRKW